MLRMLKKTGRGYEKLEADVRKRNGLTQPTLKASQRITPVLKQVCGVILLRLRNKSLLQPFTHGIDYKNNISL